MTGCTDGDKIRTRVLIAATSPGTLEVQEMFLGWFDDTRKKDSHDKIEEAIERYTAKFGTAPNLCLLNAADNTPYEGLEIKVVDYVRPNHFWVGRSDTLAA